MSFSESRELVKQALEAVGESLAKEAGDAARTAGLVGRLYLSASGWLLLSVPNAIGHGAFSALDELGIEQPKKHGVYNAHISVMRPEEIEQLGGPDKITERGKFFHYHLGVVKSVEPGNWKGVSKVWYLTVYSPELKALRASYGLSPLPNKDWDFHCTIGIKKTGVLRDNTISKAAGWLPDFLTGAKSTPTEWLNFEELSAEPYDDELDYRLYGDRASQSVLHRLTNKENQSVATVGLRAMDWLEDDDPEKPSRPIFEVRNFHTELPYRRKGYGRKVWDAVRLAHPQALFVVRPAAFKDKSLSDAELGAVYQRLGFQTQHKSLNMDPGAFILDSRDGHDTVKAAGEYCQHCNTRFERGDDGICNHCGKPFDAEDTAPIKIATFKEQVSHTPVCPHCEQEMAQQQYWPDEQGRFRHRGDCWEKGAFTIAWPTTEEETTSFFKVAFDLSTIPNAVIKAPGQLVGHWNSMSPEAQGNTVQILGSMGVGAGMNAITGAISAEPGYRAEAAKRDAFRGIINGLAGYAALKGTQHMFSDSGKKPVEAAVSGLGGLVLSKALYGVGYPLERAIFGRPSWDVLPEDLAALKEDLEEKEKEKEQESVTEKVSAEKGTA